MKMVRLITCENLQEAYLIKGRLANEEIECFLTNQHFTNILPLYNHMLGSGIQIMVLEKDLERSRKIIKEKLAPAIEEIICPHCGSSNIGLGLGRNKGLKLINIFIVIASLIPMGNLKPKFYCKDCREEIG